MTSEKAIGKLITLMQSASINMEALEASQEQTERKAPIYIGDGYSDGYMVYDSAECPRCGYIYEEDDGVWGEPYCPHCGQALDWDIGGEDNDY